MRVDTYFIPFPFSMMMHKMSPLMWIAKILVIVGGLNWGLVGIQGLAKTGNLNVVNLILGQWSTVENVVYLLVGLGALYMLIGLIMMCAGGCDKDMKMGGGTMGGMQK